MARDVITVRYSDVPGAIPSAVNVEPGELSLNRADGLIFYKDTDGRIRPLGDTSNSVVRPGGPVVDTGIAVSGNEFYVNDTVVRTNSNLVPDNPTPDRQSIAGLLRLTTHFPETDATGTATLNNQLVNVYTLNQQKLQNHQDTQSAGLTNGSVYQFSGVEWQPVTSLDGGTF